MELKNNYLFTLGDTKDNDIELKNYDEYITHKKSRTYPDDFVVFDFETTGLNPKIENIIQIGAIRYRNNEKAEVFNTYVNPMKPIPALITNITGIRNSDVENAPIIAQVLPSFLDFIGSDKLVAHNADFDMRFLLNNTYKLNIDKPSNEVIDTLYLSRKYIKSINGIKLTNYKLETLKEFLNIDVGSHNSVDDCLVCAEVYKKCKENMNIK